MLNEELYAELRAAIEYTKSIDMNDFVSYAGGEEEEVLLPGSLEQLANENFEACIMGHLALLTGFHAMGGTAILGCPQLDYLTSAEAFAKALTGSTDELMVQAVQALCYGYCSAGDHPQMESWDWQEALKGLEAFANYARGELCYADYDDMIWHIQPDGPNDNDGEGV